MFELFITLVGAMRRDDKAVTAMEYGLIAALIAVAIIGILTTVGGNLTNVFSSVSTALAAA